VNNQGRNGENVPLKFQECSDVMCDMGKSSPETLCRMKFVLFCMADNNSCVDVYII
jgi:hypothetical protein